MLGGIIAGALSGGAQATGQVADDTIAQNNKVDLLRVAQQLDIQKMQAAEKIRQSGILAENTGPLAEAVRGNKAATETAVGKAQTGVLADRTTTLAPLEASRAGLIADAQNDAARRGEAAYASDPNARAGVRAKTADSENSATRAAAASSGYDLSRRKVLDGMRDEAANLVKSNPDDPSLQAKLQAIQIATGQVQPKSFNDVVGAAKILESQANDLLDPLKGGDPTDPAKKAQAEVLKQQARDLVQGVSDRKLPGVGGKPAPAPAGKAPYAEGARLVGPDGKFYVVKGGKPVLEGSN